MTATRSSTNHSLSGSDDLKVGGPPDDNPTVWNKLRNDRVFKVAAGVFAASLIPYVVPVLGAEQQSLYARRWVDLPQLAAIWIALLCPLAAWKREARSPFWVFVALSVLSLTAIRLAYVSVPPTWWNSSWSVAAGTAYLTSFLMMVLAIQANKRLGYRDGVATAGATGLRIAGPTVFLFGLFVYFVVIPEAVGAGSDPWVPSFYIYLGLDLYLLVSFLSSRLAVRGPWKPIYRWLATWAGLMLLADTLEFLMHTGVIAENAYGEPLDVIWMLPYAALIGAARVRAYASDSLADALARRPPGWAEPFRYLWQRPLVGYAFTFPLIHFTLYGSGAVDPGFRGPREIVVSVMLLSLGAMAIAYQKGLERQKREADQAIARYVQLEKLVAEMSTHFISLDPSEVHASIDRALADIGEFVGVDRSFVFRFNSDGSVAECVNEWCAEGIVPQIDNLQGIAVDEFPWIFGKLRRGEVVHVPRVAELPPEAGPLRQEAERGSTVSLINVPLVSSSGVVGFVGFDSVREEKTWSDQSIQLLRLVGEMFLNLLERKWAAEERKNLETQLRQSQKVEALGTLAGGIAHDLNNMLQPIVGYSEMIRDEVEVGSPTREHIDQVHLAATRARELTRQILDFGRQDNGGDMVAIPLADVIKEALRLLRVALPSSVEFDQGISSKDLFVKANAGQVHQVVLNLGSNAGDAMAQGGGTLKVQLYDVRLQRPRLAHLGKLGAGEYAKLTVGDTGTGIEPATLRRVFDPFFTTKSNGKGTGLGLALVWKIVEAHGGAIEITTAPGEGTQFAIYLPLCDEREVAVVAGQPAAPTGNERILFVDDEAAIRKLGRQLLERHGYRVSTAKDGMEARDMVRAKPDEYDLVITDLGMPRLNGVDFARAVRALRPDLPIILTTGYAESLTDEALSDLQVQALIFKPYQAEEIRRTVRQALDGSRTPGDSHREHTRT